MKNLRFQLYILAAITLIGILATVISPALTQAAIIDPKIKIITGPTEDPPGGAVTPTFSGLIVTGTTTLQSTLNANGNVNIADDLSVSGSITNNASDSVLVNSNLKIFAATDRIGRFYSVLKTLSVDHANAGDVTADCNEFDVRVSCSSYFQATGNFYGARPWGTRGCHASGQNNSGFSVDLTAYAYCFSPDG